MTFSCLLKHSKVWGSKQGRCVWASEASRGNQTTIPITFREPGLAHCWSRGPALSQIHGWISGYKSPICTKKACIMQDVVLLNGLVFHFCFLDLPNKSLEHLNLVVFLTWIPLLNLLLFKRSKGPTLLYTDFFLSWIWLNTYGYCKWEGTYSYLEKGGKAFF